MLKRKFKECKSCGLNKLIWKDGMCSACALTSKSPMELQNSFFNRKSPFPKKGLKTQLKKTRKANKGNKDFYKEVYDQFQDSPVSFESGKSLGELGTVNMAHIFPKEVYKSLAHDLRNIILLTWEEHTRFDDLLMAHNFGLLEDEFESWSKICEAIRFLLPLCEEEGKLKNSLKKYLKL